MKNNFTRSLASLAALATALTAPSAFACGGFFCDNANPVNQAAERIIFAADGERVTQIVEVLYDGPAERFSWVLPVPGVPTPDVSSVQALDRLQAATNPTYLLQSNFIDDCGARGSADLASGGDGDGDSASEDGGPSVMVLDAGSVGPFNYETISVNAADEDPADVAVEWLIENGYEAGPMSRQVLGPYLANGLNLIAFRLQKGLSAGAIRPISLEYESNVPAIPILPTAVAANDDMPILVWVLGDHRAVSTNYRGLEINELLIDWFNPSDSYNEVVIAAANEAGGQGFVTEMAGSTDGLADSIALPWEMNELQYYSADSGVESVVVNVSEIFGQYDGFREVVTEHLPLRNEMTAEDFLTCPYCYFYPGQAPELGFGGSGEYSDEPIPDTDPIYDTDIAAFLAAVEEDVLLPIADTAALFDEFDYVTRLYTTMSADEMTLDPVFDFNPDLEDVDRNHTAIWNRYCGSDEWSVELASGQKVYGSGNEWPYALGSADLPANVRVLQYSTSGAPEIITDNTATIQSTHLSSEAGAPAESSEEKKGGLCAVEERPSGSSPWAWLIPAGLLGAWYGRRRWVTARIS